MSDPIADVKRAIAACCEHPGRMVSVRIPGWAASAARTELQQICRAAPHAGVEVSTNYEFLSRTATFSFTKRTDVHFPTSTDDIQFFDPAHMGFGVDRPGTPPTRQQRRRAEARIAAAERACRNALNDAERERFARELADAKAALEAMYQRNGAQMMTADLAALHKELDRQAREETIELSDTQAADMLRQMQRQMADEVDRRIMQGTSSAPGTWNGPNYLGPKPAPVLSFDKAKALADMLNEVITSNGAKTMELRLAVNGATDLAKNIIAEAVRLSGQKGLVVTTSRDKETGEDVYTFCHPDSLKKSTQAPGPTLGAFFWACFLGLCWAPVGTRGRRGQVRSPQTCHNSAAGRWPTSVRSLTTCHAMTASSITAATSRATTAARYARSLVTASWPAARRSRRPARDHRAGT